MELNYDQLEVKHNEDANRFEVALGDQIGEMVYSKRTGNYVFLHTEVPKEHGGRGIADKMAKFALETARSEGVKVVPLCPFVKKYIARHPEYEELVAGSV